MTFWHPDITAYARHAGVLLRGAGRYVDDIRVDNEAHCFVLRSPYAHARIHHIDTSQAKEAPGVLAVITAADLAGRMRPLGCVMPLVSRDGRPRVEADRPVLAVDKVRHVGEAVAFVVAGTIEAATDAAGLILVKYEPLPIVTAPGPSPVPVWDQAPDNLCFDWQFGDADACRRLFDTAAHVTRIELVIPRVAATPIEPRAALAIHDPADDAFTLVTNTQPDKRMVEGARLTFGGDGSLDVVVGTQSTGQDHAAPLRHAAATFGLAPGKVSLRQGDTAMLGRGGGTGGSKSLLTSSRALEQAIVDVVARGRAVLARHWNVPPQSIGFRAGVFSRDETNSNMSVAEMAKMFPGALDGESCGVLEHGSCANGCHACELEIDSETGQVEVLAYTAVDDFGTVQNAAAVRGQIQGGVAQGVGEALMECLVNDPASGQPLAGSLMDYAMPRATEVPEVCWTDNGLTSRTNLFGAKACAEAGASAAPPAVMNAIADALAAFSAARALQMPARAADIWRVIHDR